MFVRFIVVEGCVLVGYYYFLQLTVMIMGYYYLQLWIYQMDQFYINQLIYTYSLQTTYNNIQINTSTFIINIIFSKMVFISNTTILAAIFLVFSHLYVTISMTYPPVWITNNYVRAGNSYAISTLTGNNQTPIYTFPFSSPFTTGIPNLGYGIKAYQGNDYFGEQFFQVNRTDLTMSSFSVAVQILGVTNIYVLNVPYIAIDLSFPHHLNSFDNVPVNYGAGSLVNISVQDSSSTTYYTNHINYTQQVGTSSIYNTFLTPYSRNKVLLFMTSLFIQGALQSTSATTFNSLDFRVNGTVVSSDVYELSVSLRINIKITKLHFSIVIFDQQDVEASGLYLLIYQKVQFIYDAGGFIPIPFQFVDNFIMGFTQWSSNRTRCAIHFQWDFQTVGGVQGVFMPVSVGRSPLQTVINQIRFTMFYMKTWTCPSQTFFDPATDLCTGCPIHNCLNCYTLYVCATCDTANGYTLNSVTGLCQAPPSNNNPTISIQRSSCNGLTIKVPRQEYQTWSSVTIQNSNVVVSSYEQLNDVMIIVAEYSSDIVNQKIKLRIQPNFYQELDYNPVVPAVFYSQSQCQTMENIQKLVVGILVVSYVILLLSVVSLKIVGLELFGVLQLAYFTLASHSYFDLYLSPLKDLRPSNGLNIKIMQDNSNLPSHFQQMNVSAAFLNNFNIMFFLNFVELIVGLVLYFIGKCFFKQKVQKISVILLRQGFITLIFFNIFNISFSTGIQWKYGTDSTYAWANYAIISICLIGVIIAVFLMESAKRQSQYGQFKKKFKDTCVCKIYIFLSILYRMSLGFYTALKSDYQQATLIILAFSLLFVMYNIINLPFSSAIQNYRANLCHLTQMVILVTSNYYRSMKSTTPIQIKSHLHTAAIIQVIMIILCVFLSLSVLTYQIAQIIKQIKLSQKDKKVTNVQVVRVQGIEQSRNTSQANIGGQHQFHQNTMQAIQN